MPSKYLPAISELRTSLRLRSKEYLRENSLHGFPYFMDPSKPNYTRVGWFICVVASLGAAIGTVMTIWEKFQTSPTLMGLDILTDDVSIYYPNIYICMDWNTFQVENNSKLDPDQEPYFQKMYNWNWDTSIDINININFAAFFHDLAPDCNELFSNCYYKTEGCEFFQKIVTPVGVCCLFEGKLLRKEDFERTLQFETDNIPMRIYLTGEHDNSLSPFDGPVHELLTGSVIKFDPVLTFTKIDVKFLSHHQRQCTFNEESDSFVNCELRCLIEKIISVCSCLPWFLASLASRECKPKQYSCLIQARQTWSPLDCKCYLSCDQTSYQVEDIDQNWDSKQTNITLNRWPQLLFKRETRFGWVDLAVSFGGIAGFFLGYSLLISFEFFYYFTLRSYFGAVLSAPKKGILNIMVKPAPKKLIINKEVENFKKENPFYYEFVN